MTGNVQKFPKQLTTAHDALPPTYSDEFLALRFADRHAEALRYVAQWCRWMKWDDTRWVKDLTLEARDLARAVCREASSKCGGLQIGMKVASARAVSAIEALAKADRRLAATVGQWDADPWRLNTPGGTIDLRMGKSNPHDRADYCTKITAVAPAGECPLWLNFLTTIFAGDTDLIAMRRLLGYSLTGVTNEHALFFFYGTGANGKSVLINTVAGVLCDHHRTAPVTTFTASAFDRHPTELAALCGARLVTAVETEEGREWAEVTDWRRQDCGTLYASRLLRVYSAVQISRRRESQAQFEVGR
jgi:putative DNA primase/helicase